jgi:hypothetical protein
MGMLLSELLVFAFLKLKEFKHARSFAKDCIKKLSKSGMFGNENDIVPFPLKFISAVSLYCESNSRNKSRALVELYQMLRECDLRPGSQQKSVDLFGGSDAIQGRRDDGVPTVEYLRK